MGGGVWGCVDEYEVSIWEVRIEVVYQIHFVSRMLNTPPILFPVPFAPGDVDRSRWIYCVVQVLGLVDFLFDSNQVLLL